MSIRLLQRPRFNAVTMVVGIASLFFAGCGDTASRSGQQLFTAETVSGSRPSHIEPDAADPQPLVATPVTVSTVPESTVPESTVPESTVAVTTVAISTAPVSTIQSKPATLDQLAPATVNAPVQLRIDETDIDAPVVPVSASMENGELSIPPSADVIAWYEHGASPGDEGSAVLAAHVDWRGSLGAFYSLIDVPPGATVVTTMADGSTRSFVVTSTEQIPKDALPGDPRIFRRTGPQQLVLITCGGYFNRETRHYDDNIVVFASAVS